MSRNYKNISVNFNLDNPNDALIYDWLMGKRAKTAFIKDLLEMYMNDEFEKVPIVNNKKKETLSVDDIEKDLM